MDTAAARVRFSHVGRSQRRRHHRGLARPLALEVPSLPRGPVDRRVEAGRFDSLEAELEDGTGDPARPRERRAVDCLVTFAPRGGGDDDEEEDRDHRDSSVLRGDDDGESEGCSDPDGRDDDEDDDWGDDDDNRGDDDDDESDEGVGMVHCHLTPWFWAHARRGVLDADGDAIANLRVKADEILARIPLEEAKDTPVQDPSNQGRFDRELERAERALARAREAWDRDQHDDVIRHFEKAWKHAQNAMRIARS